MNAKKLKKGIIILNAIIVFFILAIIVDVADIMTYICSLILSAVTFLLIYFVAPWRSFRI